MSLHSLIKIPGEKIWQVKWLLDYNKSEAPWLAAHKVDFCFCNDGIIQKPAVWRQQFVNSLSVLHSISAFDLESKNDNSIDSDLNRFPTIFTSIKWMISFAIPDNDLKVTALEFWLRCLVTDFV